MTEMPGGVLMPVCDIGRCYEGSHVNQKQAKRTRNTGGLG